MYRKKPFVLAGWKCNGTKDSIQQLLQEYSTMKNTLEMDIAICPSFIHLPLVGNILKNTNNTRKDIYLNLGAQNCSSTSNGAYTGEISASQLKDIGVNYVMIGHSERRNYYKETNQIVSNKIKMALQSNMIAVVCLGETLTQRKENLFEKVLSKQLEYIFKAPKDLMRRRIGILMNNQDNDCNDKSFEKMCISQIILLYEPIWAIGTGNVCNGTMAQATHKMIRDWIKKNISSNVADKIRITYGGSVEPHNVKDLIKQKDIDGVGVGGASLNGSSFVDIVNTVKTVYFETTNEKTSKL